MLDDSLSLRMGQRSLRAWMVLTCHPGDGILRSVLESGMNFEFNNVKKSSHQMLCQWQVQPGLQVLDGHFPGYPILPGVAQIQVIMSVIRKWFSPSAQLASIARCKFSAPLLPGDNAIIRLQIVSENKFKWSIDCGRKRISQGTLTVDNE